jgi:hypothetical protein
VKERFPIIEWDVSVGDAARTMAVHKARGAVVRRGQEFKLVGFRDIAKALDKSKHTWLGDVGSIVPVGPVGAGDIAHIELDEWLKKHGALIEATQWECSCGYSGSKPKERCSERPCQQQEVG